MTDFTVGQMMNPIAYSIENMELNMNQIAGPPTMEQIIRECTEQWDQINGDQGLLVNYERDLRNRHVAYQQRNGHRELTSEEMTHLAHDINQRGTQLSIKQAELSSKRRALIDKINQGTQLLQRKKPIDKRIKDWRINQKTEQIGEPFESKEEELDNIHTEFNYIFAHISELRKFTCWTMEPLSESDNNAQTQDFIRHLRNLLAHLDNMWQELLEQTPLVCKQPEPILKTKTKTKPLELHFFGAEKMGIKQELDHAEVLLDIITEEDARQLAAGAGQVNLNNIKPVGKVTNRVQRVMANEKQQMIAKFNDYKVETVDRRTKIAQKYVFLFRCKTRNGEISFWALSLPFMVTVHGSQGSELHSSIFWQRAFGSIDYVGEIKDERFITSWSKLEKAIIHQFKSFTGAERSFKYGELAKKMPKLAKYGDSAEEEAFITFDMFSKERMNDGVAFSCWDWLFSIMQLIKQKEVLEFWENNWLHGIISKEEAEQSINALADVALLLRFSDSQLGAISIVYPNETKGRLVEHLTPFSADDFHKLSLKERINCDIFKNIRLIYPNIDKQLIVGKKGTETRIIGYVKAEVTMVIRTDSTINEIQQMNTIEVRRGTSFPFNSHSVPVQSFSGSMNAANSSTRQHLRHFSMPNNQMSCSIQAGMQVSTMSEEAIYFATSYSSPGNGNICMEMTAQPMQWSQPNGYPLFDESTSSQNGTANRFAMQQTAAQRANGNDVHLPPVETLLWNESMPDLFAEFGEEYDMRQN